MDTTDSAEISAVSTSAEQTRARLERMHHDELGLTMTGIGSIAKSLTEKQQGHEDILRAVNDILVHLTAKETPPC